VFSVVGKGVYTISQAAKLLRLYTPSVNAPGVNRWAFGYKRRGTAYRPAIDVEASRERTLTFLELVELMHVASLLESGKSWKKVREAVRVARKLFPDEPHPFALRKWFADATSLYMELGEKHNKPILVEMAGDAQVVMTECLRTYLRQIEFDPDTERANRWRPANSIIIDPERSFGQPIVTEGGVRTDILVEHYHAGDTINTIAAWYDLAEPEVEAAIQFEERLSTVPA